MTHDDEGTETSGAGRPRTPGEVMADAVASFGGSWGFILIFVALTTLWILINTGRAAFDPYPYLLMNLGLNLVAAIQAPIIMMSQRRQETRDRARAQTAYRLIQGVDLEMRALHAKLDRLATGTR